MWRYDDTRVALRDALRLARGMTYKSAVAGLDLGGGKGVIALPPDAAPPTGRARRDAAAGLRRRRRRARAAATSPPRTSGPPRAT